MNEKAMIEEMAKDFLEIDVYNDNKCINCTRYICNDSCDNDCFAKLYAKYFYNLHYRKIPEGSVVLSKEEYNELKSRAEEVFNEMTERMKAEVKIAGRMGVIKGSKETAKEILQALLDFVNCEKINQGHSFEKIKETLIKVAKAYEVEVEE